MPSNDTLRKRLADRSRPPRDGRNGIDGRDGSRGLKGDRGEPGLRGADGTDGRDAALVDSMAFFVKDEDTHETIRVDLEDMAGAMILTITPVRDQDRFIVAAQIKFA